MTLFFLFPVLNFLVAIFCSRQIFYRNTATQKLSVPAVIVTLILHVSALLIMARLSQYQFIDQLFQYQDSWGGAGDRVRTGFVRLIFFSTPVVFVFSVVFFSPMALRKRLGIYLGGLLTVIMLALFAQYVISEYQYTAYRNNIELLKLNNIQSEVIKAPAFGFDANSRDTDSSRFKGYLPVPEEVETQFSHTELGGTYPTWSINADTDTEKESLISVHVYEKPASYFEHLIDLVTNSRDSGLQEDPLFIVFDATQKTILATFALPKPENQWGPYLADVADLNGDQKDEIIYSLVDDWANDNFYVLYLKK